MPTIGGSRVVPAQPGGGGGSGWPTVNGTGSGNLTAQTLVGDTVGYNFVDQGSGGINLTTSVGSTGPLSITAEGNEGIAVSSRGGLSVGDGSSVGLAILETGASGIAIETSGGGATTGIALTTQATDTGGITLANVGGQIKVPNLPTTDPSVAHALWNDGGTVVLSGSTAGQTASMTVGFGLGGVGATIIQGACAISLDPVAHTGTGGITVTSVPSVVGAAAQLVSAMNVAFSNIDTTHDAFDINVAVNITNLAGTQFLVIQAVATMPQVGPGQSLDIDWSTATTNPIAGTDLVFVGTGPGAGTVTSTAGGTYWVSVDAAGNYD